MTVARRRQDEPPYVPTPEELEIACRKIREEWYDQRTPKVYSEKEYGKRHSIHCSVDEDDQE